VVFIFEDQRRCP